MFLVPLSITAKSYYGTLGKQLIAYFLIFLKNHLYASELTPLFIKYFPDVYVEEDGKIRNVRKAWKPEEYIMNSVVEE